jgi:hypothetical protein
MGLAWDRMGVMGENGNEREWEMGANGSGMGVAWEWHGPSMGVGTTSKKKQKNTGACTRRVQFPGLNQGGPPSNTVDPSKRYVYCSPIRIRLIEVLSNWLFNSAFR